MTKAWLRNQNDTEKTMLSKIGTQLDQLYVAARQLGEEGIKIGPVITLEQRQEVVPFDEVVTHAEKTLRSSIGSLKDSTDTDIRALNDELDLRRKTASELLAIEPTR